MRLTWRHHAVIRCASTHHGRTPIHHWGLIPRIRLQWCISHHGSSVSTNSVRCRRLVRGCCQRFAAHLGCVAVLTRSGGRRVLLRRTFRDSREMCGINFIERRRKILLHAGAATACDSPRGTAQLREGRAHSERLELPRFGASRRFLPRRVQFRSPTGG